MFKLDYFWVVGGKLIFRRELDIFSFSLGGGRAGVHKTGIRGIQDTRQIVDGKTNDIENNDKKGGSKPLT